MSELSSQISRQKKELSGLNITSEKERFDQIELEMIKKQDRLNLLLFRDRQLKEPLKGEKYLKDSHRLNQHDHHHLPEYEPYSLVSTQFDIIG